MSKAKFYQGPLFAVKNSASGWEVKVGPRAYDQSTAFIGKNNEHIPDFDAEATAILYAASPELLAACKAAERYLGCTDTNDIAGLRAAIAKAEGRT